MKRQVLLTPVLLLAVIALSACRQTPRTENQLIAALDSLQHKFEWLDHRTAQENWQLYTRGHSDSLEFFQGLGNHVVSNEDVIHTLSAGESLLKDETDRRRFQIIWASMMRGQVETKPVIARLRDSLAALDVSFRATLDGRQRTQSELCAMYRSDRDRGRREEAYRAWCSVGDTLADGLSRLFRLRNQGAQQLGYKNYMAMVFRLENESLRDYMRLVHRLDSVSAELYGDVLEDVRDRMGYSDLEIWDIGFAFSEARNRIDRYFPADSQLAYVDQTLEAIGFNIDKLPIYFDLQPRTGKSQLANAILVKPPYDVRVLANVTDGAYSTRVLMHEIGHALHFTHITQDNSLFVNRYEAPWTEGVAQFLAAFLDQESWLEAYPKVPPELVRDFLSMRRYERVIDLRMRLTQLQFEYEAYSNPGRDLNELYWELFERHMMLPRHDDIRPWAAVIHYVSHPVYLQSYLIADMVAAQTTAFFKRDYGDPVANPQLGAFLTQNYFRFGSRYDWRSLLKRGTDEKLNPDYLLKDLTVL